MILQRLRLISIFKPDAIVFNNGPMKMVFGIWFLLLSLLLFARGDDPLRVEFPASGRSEGYHLILAGQQGFIVLRKEGGSDNNNTVWRVFGYSPFLEQRWEDSLELPEDLELAAKDYHQGVAGLVFLHSSNRGSSLREVWVEMRQGVVGQYGFHVEEPLIIRDYKTAGQQSFLLAQQESDSRGVIGRIFQSGKDDDRQLKVIRLDRKARKHEYICDHIKMGMRPSRMDVFHYEQTIDVYTVHAPPEGHHQIYMHSFSMSGEIMNIRRIAISEGKSVVDVAVTSRDSMRFIAATVSGVINRYNRYEDYTDGIFFCSITHNGEINARLYTLSNITSFYRKAHAEMFQFFPGRRDSPGSAGYPLQIHPVLKGRENEMILLAEAYYPEYLTQIYYDAYGMSRTRRVFNGYKYTHALALAFNDEAGLLWHEAMEIRDIKTYSRKIRTDIISDGTQAGIIYSLNNKLRYQIVSNGKAIGDVGSASLPLKYRNDMVKRSRDNQVVVWHGDYLLAYGYQDIENRSEGNRSVFFVQKIAFH